MGRGTQAVDSANQISINDVAEALGVSISTVSRAISGHGRVGKATRERVLAYIDEIGYMPNSLTYKVEKKRTANICACIPGAFGPMDMEFFQSCLAGIQEICLSNNFDIIISLCLDDDLSSLERVVENKKVDGVILLRTYTEDPQIEYLKQHEIPFVTVGRTPEKYGTVYQVDHDHEAACKELTQVILMKGMRKTALIGSEPELIITRKRVAGYKAAILEAGLPLDEDLIFFGGNNNMMVDNAIKEAIAKGVDCILCSDDDICNRVLSRLADMDLHIPDDIRVASFYCSRALERNTPSITAISFDSQQMGMLSCQVLLDLIGGKEVQNLSLLPYEVVLKESTKL